MKNPDLILTSDIHIRETQPTSRTDDFVNITQWKKLDFLSDLQKKYGCPILNAGDLFHRGQNTNWLITKAIQHIPDKFWTICGDHDYPNKSIELGYKSSVETLSEAHIIDILEEVHWGQEPNKGSFFVNGVNGFPDRNIVVMHRFVWDGLNWPWPDCPEMTADEVLDKYPQFDLIVTGDYHKGFTYEKDGRLLVNSGCLSRQTADYADYQPRVYLWYAENNTVEPVYIPIEKDVVTRQHIEKKEQHDERLTAFVTRLNDEWDTTVSFEENMKRFFSANKVKSEIKEIINKSMEDEFKNSRF